MIEFYIPLETPAKKNSRVFNTKTLRSFPSKTFRAWHDSATAYILQQRKCGAFPLSVPVSITLSFFHGDLRRRDSDNGVSSILDLLVDCKILADDNWQIVQSISFHNHYRKGSPCCYITISPQEAAQA